MQWERPSSKPQEPAMRALCFPTRRLRGNLHTYSQRVMRGTEHSVGESDSHVTIGWYLSTHISGFVGISYARSTVAVVPGVCFELSTSMIRWVVALCSLILGLHASVDVMKDVTLGFGEALQHCREESQLSEDKMEEFFHFWRDDFKFEDRALGCALRCMSAHFNLLTDEHRMHHQNTDKFIRSFPNGEALSQRMVALLQWCELQHDAEREHCWRVLRVAECFKLASVRAGLAPSMEVLMAEFIMEAEAS